jgi:transcriptional regulator with XRE-family HTH domain
MDVRTRFGIAMQRMRRERGFSQEDLSGLTEIDRAYVGRLERGEANPTLLMLVRIAHAFGVTLPGLFDGVIFDNSDLLMKPKQKSGRRSPSTRP